MIKPYKFLVNISSKSVEIKKKKNIKFINICLEAENRYKKCFLFHHANIFCSQGFFALIYVFTLLNLLNK